MVAARASNRAGDVRADSDAARFLLDPAVPVPDVVAMEGSVVEAGGRIEGNRMHRTA